MANPVGRPRIFESPEDFDRLVDNYVSMCGSVGEPLTLTGMILALGLYSKNTFYEYGKLPEFKDSVTRARMFIEQAYEKKLHLGPKEVSSSSITFALKNMDWSDRVALDHGGQNGSNPVVTDNTFKIEFVNPPERK